jgi:hypothetical protein
VPTPLVEDVLKAARKRPDLAQAWGPQELAAAGFRADDPHTPDVVLVAPEDALWGRKVPGGGVRTPGMHGYMPEHPKLQGVFLAGGPDLVGGQLLANLRVVDVAPLVAKLQGLAWPTGRGVLRAELLRKSP